MRAVTLLLQVLAKPKRGGASLKRAMTLDGVYSLVSVSTKGTMFIFHVRATSPRCCALPPGARSS
jgi:hypothetical protein